jgi:alpha-amylase/alpha-mannosidase (GH57 family)
MPVDDRLRVVLCWHMHQPQYRDLANDRYRQPWTYLHAIKDYVDMAAHLELVPAARAVVNFAPVLIEQIEDYARMVRAHLEHGRSVHDPLLAALANPSLPASRGERDALVTACLRSHEHNVIARFPGYQRLAQLAKVFNTSPYAYEYVDDQFVSDLLVWYHLAWMGETVRRTDKRVQALMDKQAHYSMHDRTELVGIIGELLDSVLPRYRALHARGQVELCVSPYAHPIVPLLLEIGSAREAMPDAPLPEGTSYPGGEARARWHIEHGLAVFERVFGHRPRGCWPSEGSVSDATLALLEDYGFDWAATGESVLHHSVSRIGEDLENGGRHYLFQPHQVGDGKLACWFRDDRLSDQIGFVYADWRAEDAVANLVHHLENIATHCKARPGSVVSIILDGENAWEYYPENAFHFLNTLYTKLSQHPGLRLTTYGDCLDDAVPANRLPHLVAGSWVYGTFSTWIGEHDKNRGWDMLIDAKRAFDTAVEGGLAGERLRRAEDQLAVCEGSDWFWWFGGENAAPVVAEFDQLYRMHLSHLYQLLGVEPPEYLSRPFTFGGGSPLQGGTMKTGQPAA